jgi:hypothetical protein
MKHILLLFWLLFSFLSGLEAQSRFNFTGYVLDLPVYEHLNKSISDIYGISNNQYLNLARVRLSPSLILWNNARIDAAYEIDGLYYNSSYGLQINPLLSINRQILNLKWTAVNEKHLSIIHYIDRLSFRQDIKQFSAVIGRQRIAWGTGRIWNPTDMFNPINPASYYKIEKDGADAVSLKYAFASFTDLNVVYNPQEKIRNSNYGFRFRTNHWEYDMSLMGGYFDRRIVGGMDFAGNLFNAGVRGEGIISANKDSLSKHYVKFILGIDNQFTASFYGLLEYYFNGEGKSNTRDYDIAGLNSGTILNLSKNYICASSVYQVFPLLNLTFTDITNLNDLSGFVSIIASFSAKENLTLSAGIQNTYGSAASEYWYYPFSFYMQAQYYF